MADKAMRMVLDVDTGSDDAIAILSALYCEHISLQWIATCFGNVSVEEATDNSLRVLRLAGSDIPVYAGAAAPIARDLYPGRDQREFCGAVIDGAAFRVHEPALPLPPATRNAEKQFAPFHYLDYFRKEREPVTMVVTGPLTNLGIALSLWPELSEKIERLVVMGGGFRKSNVTAYAEANFWNDPEAAAIVLKSGIHPLIVPLDATHAAYVKEEEYLKIFDKKDALHAFCRSIFERRKRFHDIGQPLAEANAATIHDAVAVCAALQPELITNVQTRHCEISLDAPSSGHLLVDRRENAAEANADVCLHADRAFFRQWLADTLHNKTSRSEKE